MSTSDDETMADTESILIAEKGKGRAVDVPEPEGPEGADNLPWCVCSTGPAITFI
jgi:hypothetical protein